jgi:hypothetical protein
MVVVQASQSGHPALVTRDPKSSGIQTSCTQKIRVGIWKKRSAKRRVVLMFPGEKLGGNVLGFLQSARLKLLNSHVALQPTFFWKTLNVSLSGNSG